MGIYESIKKRRTIRKFSKEKISIDILKRCVDSVRHAPSGSNLQPLEFIISTKNLDQIYKTLSWAGYIKDFDNSENKPTAYITILSNKKIRESCKLDVGIAAENIVLTAFEKYVGSCIVGSINRKSLSKILGTPKNMEIELVIALGYPAEKSKEINIKKDIKYFYKKGILNVPKRSLKDILHINKY